jgi:hypothetical protein
LDGLTGQSDVLPVVWSGHARLNQGRAARVIQAFNVSVLSLALLSHLACGLLTPHVGW